MSLKSKRTETLGLSLLCGLALQMAFWDPFGPLPMLLVLLGHYYFRCFYNRLEKLEDDDDRRDGR